VINTPKMRPLTITFLFLLLVSFSFAQPKAPAAPATPEFVISVEGVKVDQVIAALG
jgi:hypothetical protein